MKSKKKADEKSWVMPGVKLTHDEFLEGIKKAEEGPFYTIEELKKKMSEWKQAQK